MEGGEEEGALGLHGRWRRVPGNKCFQTVFQLTQLPKPTVQYTVQYPDTPLRGGGGRDVRKAMDDMQ